VSAVISASSSLDGDAPDAIYGPRATQEVRWRGHNPTDLAGNLRGMDLQVRTANGVFDPAIGEQPADLPFCAVEPVVQGSTVDFHEQLDALKIGHLFKQYDT